MVIVVPGRPGVRVAAQISSASPEQDAPQRVGFLERSLGKGVNEDPAQPGAAGRTLALRRGAVLLVFFTPRLPAYLPYLEFTSNTTLH